MSTIQYCSDFHLEFPENMAYLERHPIEPHGDILLLAGDIVPFALLHKFDRFFDELSEKFKQVYWLPGNHEYYCSDIKQRTGSFTEEIRKNILLLNNQTVINGNAKLVFSTLWANISEENKAYLKRYLSDFHVIKCGDDDYGPENFNEFHQQSKDFITEALKQENGSNTVILVTHHVPTLLNYPDKHKGDVLNEGFAIELFDFIADSPIDYWVYGHHHHNCDTFTIGKTKMLTNQLGYVKHHEHTTFSTSAVFSV
ncbi:MAG: metallophosphoesterase [Cyclobacteriaceae bacterium]|nr:metallophosphoesterase [Cyclobacteriaceae bacterium]